MWPAAGGVTEGSGRMSYSGWPVAAASKSPTSAKVDVAREGGVARHLERRAVDRRRRGGRQGDLDRRLDGEVRDRHHRSAVDGEDQPVAVRVLVIERPRRVRRADAAQHADLRPARWWDRDRREGGAGIRFGEVDGVVPLQRVRAHRVRGAVVVLARPGIGEVADVERDEAAERVVRGLAVRPVHLELRPRAQLAGRRAAAVSRAGRPDRPRRSRWWPPWRRSRGSWFPVPAGPRSVGSTNGRSGIRLERAAGASERRERRAAEDAADGGVDVGVDRHEHALVAHDHAIRHLVWIAGVSGHELLGPGAGDGRARACR